MRAINATDLSCLRTWGTDHSSLMFPLRFHAFVPFPCNIPWAIGRHSSHQVSWSSIARILSFIGIRLFIYLCELKSRENKYSQSWRQLEKGLMAMQDLAATWKVAGNYQGNLSSLSTFTRNSKYASDVKSQQPQLLTQKWHNVSELPYWEQGPRKKSWFCCVSPAMGFSFLSFSMFIRQLPSQKLLPQPSFSSMQ